MGDHDYPFLIIHCIIIALGFIIIGYGIFGFIYGQTFKVNDTYCKTPHFKANYLCSNEHLTDRNSPPIDIRDDAIPSLMITQ
jgi:hypothetical protein